MARGRPYRNKATAAGAAAVCLTSCTSFGRRGDRSTYGVRRPHHGDAGRRRCAQRPDTDGHDTDGDDTDRNTTERDRDSRHCCEAKRDAADAYQAKCHTADGDEADRKIPEGKDASCTAQTIAPVAPTASDRHVEEGQVAEDPLGSVLERFAS